MPYNAFDLLIIVFLIVGIMYGAIRGATRQIIGLLSAWLALIACLWLYIPFSRRILLGMFTKAAGATSPEVFDTASFIMLLVLFAIFIQVIFIQTTKSPEEKRDTSGKSFIEKAEQKKTVNVLAIVGGLVMGFVVTVVWMSVFLAPIQFVIFAVRSSNSFLNGLQGAMQSSALLPLFNRTLSLIWLSVRPFAPTDLPAIFAGFIG